jgi:hypothetical protein
MSKYSEECDSLHETIDRMRKVKRFLGPAVPISIGTPSNDVEEQERMMRDEVDVLIKNIPEVWVVGEQSAGKSTLVNRLIGFSIMPSGSREDREHSMITCRPSRFTTEMKRGYSGPPKIELKFYELDAERSKADELVTLRYAKEDSYSQEFKPSEPQGAPLHEQLKLLHDPQSVIEWASVRYSDENRSASLDVQDIEKLTIDIKLILPPDHASTSDTEQLEYVSFVDIPGLMVGEGENVMFDRILSRLFNEIFQFAKRDASDERFKQMIETIPCNKDDMTNSFTGGQEEAFPGHRVFTKSDDIEERKQLQLNLRGALQMSCTGTTFVVGHLNDAEMEHSQDPEDARPKWTQDEDFQDEFDRHNVQFGLKSLMHTVFDELKRKVVQFHLAMRARKSSISKALTQKQDMNFAMFPFLSRFYFDFLGTALRPVGADKFEPRKLQSLKTYGDPAGKRACETFYLHLCRLLRFTGDLLAKSALPAEDANDQFGLFLNDCTKGTITRLEDLRDTKMRPAMEFIDGTIKSLLRRSNNSIMILLTSCEFIQTSEDKLSIQGLYCAPFIDNLFKHCENDVSKSVLQKDVRISEVCESFWKSQNQHSYSCLRPHLRSEPRDQSSSAFRTPLTSLACSMLQSIQNTLSQAFDEIGVPLKKLLPVYHHLCTCFKNVTMHALFDEGRDGYWNVLALTEAKLYPDAQRKGWPAKLWTTTCNAVSVELSYNDIERFLIKEFSPGTVLSDADRLTQANVEKCLNALNSLKEEAEKRLGVLHRFANSEQLRGLGTQIVSVESESVQRISSARKQFLEAARVVERPQAESEPLFLSKQLQANIIDICVGDQDEVYWTKSTDGGYAGSETLEKPRVLYLIRLICEGVHTQPTGRSTKVHNVYKSLPEVADFYERSQMLQKRSDFGRRNIYALLQDEAFKKGSQYFRLDFLIKASSYLSDFFVEIGRLIREAQPDEKRLFIEELEVFLLSQNDDRSEKIRKESNECSLFGVSASISEDDFLGEAAKILFEQVIVCSVETQIRASGLRSDGQLLKDLKLWRDEALKLCEFKSVEETQQIILAAASIERARKALSHEKLVFFKHICTPDHELRQKFDALCVDWETNAGCPMMASQKAQMAVVCFLVEENAKTQFKAAVESIQRVSSEFFKDLTVVIRKLFEQESGQGCWYSKIMEPLLDQLRRYQPDAQFVPQSEEFNRKQIESFFSKVLDCHQRQCLESCNLNELITEFAT